MLLLDNTVLDISPYFFSLFRKDW